MYKGSRITIYTVVAVGTLAVGLASVALMGLLARSTGAFSDGDTAEAVVETTAATPTTAEPATTNATVQTTSTGPASIYISKNAYLGQSVAVLWSNYFDTGSDQDTAIVTAQRDVLASQLGVEVIAIDSNDYSTMTNGTAALAVALDFSSPSDAVSWCISVGRSTRDDCFGVLLIDGATPGSGETRAYP